MLLTTQQTADKLGVRPEVVRHLVQKGQLPNANPRKVAGGGRVMLLIDAKVVLDYKRMLDERERTKRRPPTPTATGNGHVADTSVLAIDTRLARFERKIDDLTHAIETVNARLSDLQQAWR